MKIMLLALLGLCLQCTLCKAQEKYALVKSPKQITLNQIDLFGKHKTFLFQTKETDYNSNEQNFHFSKKLDSPEFFYFFDIDTKKVEYFFLFPSDTIQINFSKDSVFITGGHQFQYSILQKLNTSNINLLFQYDGGKNSMFKSFVNAYDNAIYARKSRHEIINQNGYGVNKEYLDVISDVSELKWLDFLLAPYNPCSPMPDFIPNIRSEEYFSEIDSMMIWVSTLNDKYLNTYSFWLSKIFINYSNYVSRNSGDIKFESKFRSSSNFKSSIKNIYLTNLMLHEGNKENVHNKYLSSYLSICTEDSLKQMVLNMPYQLQKLSHDSKIQNTILLENNGQKTNWKDISQSASGKVIYVDFWASWCAGCKLNVPKIKAMKKLFPDLEVIFISKDLSKERWIKSIDTWGIDILGKQYNIDPKSELAKILTEPSIPRGTLIDKTGRIITIDAETPNSKQLNDLITTLINTN